MLPNATNVLNLAYSLVQTAVYRQSHTLTNHVLVPMGCDFRWRNASLSFEAIECVCRKPASILNLTPPC